MDGIELEITAKDEKALQFFEDEGLRLLKMVKQGIIPDFAAGNSMAHIRDLLYHMGWETNDAYYRADEIVRDYNQEFMRA